MSNLDEQFPKKKMLDVLNVVANWLKAWALVVIALWLLFKK